MAHLHQIGLFRGKAYLLKCNSSEQIMHYLRGNILSSSLASSSLTSPSLTSSTSPTSYSNNIILRALQQIHRNKPSHHQIFTQHRILPYLHQYNLQYRQANMAGTSGSVPDYHVNFFSQFSRPAACHFEACHSESEQQVDDKNQKNNAESPSDTTQQILAPNPLADLKGKPESCSEPSLFMTARAT